MDTLTPAPRGKHKPATMNFFDALRKIHEGKSVARLSWENTDYCLMRDGWLTIYTKGGFHTWTINDGDMEGEDWVIMEKSGGLNESN